MSDLGDFLSSPGNRRRIGVIAAMLTIIATVITLMNQADIAEPHWVATRQFVRDQVVQASTPLLKKQVETQLFLAKSERSRIENEIANKMVLLSQNPTMPQPVKDAINEQVRSLNSDLETTKATISDLQMQTNKIK